MLLKRIKLFFLSALILGVTTFQTSCYGPFKLTNNLYEWNDTVGSKFVNALIFFGLVIIPVYGVALLVDGVVFNTIEFFGGTNPVSMNDGEEEINIVRQKGKVMQVRKTKNNIEITELEGDTAGEAVRFEFIPEEQTWYLHQKGETHKIMTITEDSDNDIVLHYPDGTAKVFSSTFAPSVWALR